MSNRIIPIVSVIAAVLIFFFYINPTYTTDIATLQSEIESDNQAHAAALSFTDHANQLAAARDAIAPSDMDRLNGFLPDAVNNVQVILDLDNLAKRSGLQLQKINPINPVAASTIGPGAGAGDTPLGSVDISMTVTGSYDAFRAFLSGVEGSLRLLDVRQLSITGSDKHIYSYDMIIRLYWLR